MVYATGPPLETAQPFQVPATVLPRPEEAPPMPHEQRTRRDLREDRDDPHRTWPTCTAAAALRTAQESRTCPKLARRPSAPPSS
jgi:hypothetical protein